MTAPWATAHVDAELDWGDLDEQLVRRLSRASETAQRAVQRNFDKLQRGTEKSFEQIEKSFDRQMDRMDTRSKKTAATVNKNLDQIDDVHVDLDVDTDRATRNVDRWRKRQQANAKRDPITVDVDVDGDGARRDLAATQRELQAQASAHPIKQEVKVDRDRSLLGMAGSFTRIAGKASLVSVAVAGIGGAVGLAGGAIGGLVAAALPAFGALAAGAGVAMLGMDGIKKAAETAAPAFTQLKAAVSDIFATALVPGMQQASQLMGALTPQLQGIAVAASGVFNDLMASLSSMVPTLQQGLAGVASFITATSPGITKMAGDFATMMSNAAPAMTQLGSAFGGMLSSISAEFAKLDTSFFQSVADMVAQLGPALGGVVGAILSLAQNLMPVIGPLLTALSTGIQAMVPGLSQLGTALGEALTPILPILGQLISSLAGALAPALAPIGQLLQVLGQALIAVMPALGQMITSFAELAGPILGSLVTALAPVVDALAGALAQAFVALQPAIAPIAKVFQALSPVLAQIASILGDVLAQAITALMPAIETIADGFSQVMTAVQPLLPVLGEALTTAISALAPLIQTMADCWIQVVQAILPILPPLIQIVSALLPPLIQLIGALLPIMTLVTQVLAQLVPVIAPVVTLIAQLAAWVSQLLGIFISFCAQVIGVVVGWVQDMIGRFGEFRDRAGQIVSEWKERIIGWVVEAKDRVIAFVSEMWDTVKTRFSEGVESAVRFVQDLPGKIKNALSGAATWLFDTGQQAIQGLISGIKSMIGSLGNAIVDIFPGPIKSIVRGALGLAFGGLIPGHAAGGLLGMLAAGGTLTGAATTIRPGGFIVNAAATRRNRALLNRLSPRGRVLSGPGTGTSDSIAGRHNGKTIARVSRDEFYAPPEDASAIMPLLVAINAGRSLANLLAAGGHLLPGFAPGGLLPDQLRDRARQAVQSGYTWGGWGRGWNTDCSGLTSSLANMATGKARGPGEGERTATGGMASFLQARGFKDGKGPDGSLRIGWSSTHAGAQLPTGENIEHTGPEGAPAKFGADAKDPAALGQMMHLPMGGDSSSGGLGSGGSGGLGSGSSGGTPIGSGISSGSGSSASWGNSGGGSKANSSADAKRQGLTPVWVENWPASIGGGSSGGLSTGDLGAGSLSTGTTTTAAGSKDLRKGASKEEITAEIVRQGKARGLSDQDIESAVATALVESDMKNYANSNVAGSTNLPHDAVGSDHDSVGIMQQRQSWGKTEDLMDPKKAIGKYYDALEQVDGRDKMSVGQRAQAVQRSAYPGRYDEKLADAKALIAKSGQVSTTSSGNVPVEVRKTDGLGTGTTTSPVNAAADSTAPDMSGAPSQMGGNLAAWGTEALFARFLANHPELAKYAEPAGQVASSFVGGQMSAGLGYFGLDFEPTWKTAAMQYLNDNPSNSDGTNKDTKLLADAVRDLATRPFQVIVQGGDGKSARDIAQEVVSGVQREQKRIMRRYVTT